ncbi:helix-turn-helix domain-containing protein [Escherichia coli]|uniref:helix-turn-helix domain-containing protein n=1 Tax=Escherichia coli TaxID=562 RepID=UPI0008F947A1|nr:helix-turn-helix domain-containing protein [Escherichia coli]
MKAKTEPLEKKWGERSMLMGWTAIPTSLLFLQAELSISPLGFNLLMNLISHWWETTEHPYPSQESMAKRMGVSKRSIQREITTLVELGLLDKQPNKAGSKKFKGRNTYDLSKLVQENKEKTPDKISSFKRYKKNGESLDSELE